MNKAQYPTSGAAKHSHITPNSTPHYSTSRHVMCDLVVLKWWNVVCCAVREMWSVAVEMWNVQRIASRISSPVIPPPFTLHESFYIKNRLTLFQTTPHSTSRHHSSPYHIPLYHDLISNRTTSRIAPHFTLRSAHNATFHVFHATFQITPYIGHHILHLTTLHRISHAAPHLA